MRGMGEVVDAMMQSAKETRYTFERKWYDSNFFYDGYHFRYLSRTQNKIIDLSEGNSIYQPMRAIPKASRQLNGIVNLLTANDFLPVIYPERVNKAAYPPIPGQDPNTGQQVMQPNPELKAAMDEAKRIAKLSGHWLMEEWKNQTLAEKVAYMVLLTGKHFVSYMQIWPDAVKEKINTKVYDAFDVYLLGDLDELEEQPFIGKGTPKLITEMMANEMFDLDKRMQLHPDNKMASSEIKEAYMNARFGKGLRTGDASATLIQKEFFILEHLDKFNFDRIKQQKNAGDILKDRKEGDPVIRHCWVGGNVPLYECYEDLSSYPWVEYRMEPGAMYGTPMIERFIPANKSLDTIVSRMERYTNTMPLGVMVERQGEDSQITNVAGGQVVKYKVTPPRFETQAPLPNFIFNLVEMFGSYIDEQGVSLSTLNKIPQGVKAASAIESLKESEYSNLAMSQRRLKLTVKKIAEKFLDLADRFFVTPQTFTLMEKGEPTYFDIVGKAGVEGRKQLHIDDLSEDVVPISKEMRVDIEVQTGMAYTREGQKEAASKLAELMTQWVQLGIIPPQALQSFVETLLESFQYGPVADFMSTMEEFGQQGSLSDQQIEAMKVAVLEVLKDASVVGPKADEKLVDSTKLGVVEALKDTGMLKKEKPQEDKGPSKSVSFKDLPPEGKAQLAAQAGIQLNPAQIRADEQEEKNQEREMQQEQLRLKEKQVNKQVKKGKNG